MLFVAILIILLTNELALFVLFIIFLKIEIASSYIKFV